MPWDVVGLHFDFVVGTKRVRDVDNAITSIFDVLKHKHAGVITEDGFQNTPVGSWTIRYKKDVWKADVSVTKIEKEWTMLTILTYLYNTIQGKIQLWHTKKKSTDL